MLLDFSNPLVSPDIIVFPEAVLGGAPPIPQSQLKRRVILLCASVPSYSVPNPIPDNALLDGSGNPLLDGLGNILTGG